MTRRCCRSAAAGLSNLTFTGFVDNVGDYLAAFDVFILPSNREGIGSILLDAMEQGLPVVASRVGGVPDIVHDRKNGLLIDPASPAQLRDAILHAASRSRSAPHVWRSGAGSSRRTSRAKPCAASTSRSTSPCSAGSTRARVARRSMTALLKALCITEDPGSADDGDVRRPQERRRRRHRDLPGRRAARRGSSRTACACSTCRYASSSTAKPCSGSAPSSTQGRYDILHLFSNKALQNGLAASRGLPVKIVAYRGIVGNVSFFSPVSWLRFLNPRIDRIVCVADAVRDYFLQMRPRFLRLPAGTPRDDLQRPQSRLVSRRPSGSDGARSACGNRSRSRAWRTIGRARASRCSSMRSADCRRSAPPTLDRRGDGCAAARAADRREPRGRRAFTCSATAATRRR